MTVLQTFVWLAVLMLSENLISIARGYDGYQDHFDNFIWLSDVGELKKKNTDKSSNLTVSLSQTCQRTKYPTSFI
jgi:hypothetical protein